MAGVSNKHYLLVEALLYIAYNASMQPLGGKKLATILNVPPRYLEPMLQTLVRADILRSIRGPRGGYMLAKEKEVIRLDDVMIALEQEKESSSYYRFSQANQAIVQPLFQRAQQSYLGALGVHTLDDLCANAKREGLDEAFMLGKKQDAMRLDYNI